MSPLSKSTSNADHDPHSCLPLPTETVDEIISYITSLKDLSSVSLACKLLHSITVPYHLYWRSVLVRLGDSATWIKLANDARLASSIQQLYITDYMGADRRKGYYVTKLKEDAEQDQGETLNGVGLVLPELISLELGIPGIRFVESFMTSLETKTPHLTKLFIFEDGGKMYVQRNASVLKHMGRYKDFEWHGRFDDNAVLMDAISAMLKLRCPHLERLALAKMMNYWEGEYCVPVDFPHLENCSWPNLRVLELTNVNPSVAICAFLDNHALLEIVSVRTVGSIPLLRLSEEALPKLREIYMNFGGSTSPECLITLVSPMPNGNLRPLERLSLINCLVMEDDELDVFCDRLEKLSTLQVLGWEDEYAEAFDALAQVADAAVSVYDLHLKIRILNTTTVVDALASALSGFNSLRKLHFLGTLGIPVSSQLDDLETVLSESCRTLRHINGCAVNDDGMSSDAAEGKCDECDRIEGTQGLEFDCVPASGGYIQALNDEFIL